MEVRVRYCECDPMGVVHHANYAVWFEMGRTEMLRSQGGNYRNLEAAGRFLVVVDLSTRFKKPARYDDELTLVTHLLESTPARLRHGYELTRGETLLATATSSLACVDNRGSLQPIPEGL
jgi:acyl-CoA thioester hydrolase